MTTFVLLYSDDCVTPDDNGGYNMTTSDVLVYTKPSKDICPNRYTTTAVVTGPTSEPVIVYESSSCTDSSTSVIVLSITTGLFVTSTLLFLFLWIRSSMMLKQLSASDDKSLNIASSAINSPFTGSSQI